MKKLLINNNNKIYAISPLIATILLIVVAVAIIGIIISWGKNFTQENLDIDVTTYNLSNYKDFVWYDRLTGNNLQIKNLGDQSFEITGYKINTSLNSPYLNQVITLDEPIQVLNNSTQIIPLFCVPEPEFFIEIITSDSTYFNIPIKNAQMHLSSCFLDFEITSPEEDYIFVLTQEIFFSSQVNKTLGDYNCFWDSNIDGELSTDCNFTKSDLSPGTHNITLIVTDNLFQDNLQIILEIKDNLGAEITSPNNNDTFNYNETINLVGTAINYYGDYNCSWFSNQDLNLGTGCTLDVNLSKNTHTITLTVEDDLEEVTDNIILDIVSITGNITSPLNNSEYEENDTITFQASANNAYDNLYSCSWDSNIEVSTLSTECSFTKSDLSPGTHNITLIVTDNLDIDYVNINLIVNEPPCSGLPYIAYSGSYLCIHPTLNNNGDSIQWGCKDNIVSPSATSLSDGKQNTQNIVSWHEGWSSPWEIGPNGETCSIDADGNVAARYCDELDSYGFNDWYLPARSQLIDIWYVGSGSNETMNANIIKGNYESEWQNISTSDHWTSTEINDVAYGFRGSNGLFSVIAGKNFALRIRCVRDH